MIDDRNERPGDGEPYGSRIEPAIVVGVGVCAASFESLLRIFGEVDAADNAAYLIAVRQEQGLDVGSVVEALQAECAMPVRLADNGERIAPNHVYVAAPDDMIGIADGEIRTRAAHEPVGHRGTVDSLFISLAEHARDRAVAVLLWGLAPDGSAGITAIKKFGGLCIAEARPGDEITVQGAVIPGAVADLRLPVERIASEIARYAHGLGNAGEGRTPSQLAGDIETQVTQIATILRNVTSHDFHGYKRGTFVRRIHRRMQVLQLTDLDAYVERLKSDREEVQNLFQDLLIGVTQFFRDAAEFEALEREIPRLFEGKGPEDQFRVWVLGCATGEEAYSIAILLREHMLTLDRPPEVQIFATDLDARALNLARAGRYTSAIADHVRPDRLGRWFAREGDTYCVSKELRELCIFSPHNIVKDAPFSRVDILSCRNLLIYLNTDLQNRVIPIFHFSLRPGGILFLGSSENVTRHQKLFAHVDRRNRVFRRIETATRIIPDFPLTTRVRSPEAMEALAGATAPARLTGPLSRQADAVAERYAPAYVVVDTQGDVLHFSGRTGRYLEPTEGAATLNLLNLVHRDLRLDLRTALGRASAESRRVEVPRLTLRQDGRTYGVTVIVEPIGQGDATSLVVVFQDLGSVGEQPTGEDGRLKGDEHVQRLEADLRVTRDRLQATIEELESTNEELKSSNEEYQSINEELQSANEEMETSKEELQSVNEELQTVNGELAHRVSELGRINSDLKNLLESTQIATIFLDNDLRVRNFTPAATDIFHLLETDVGRPLDHVVSRVIYPELHDDVRRVLKTLVPIERQVIDVGAGRHFAARVLPYRSVDNYISGAVVTFTDFTDLFQAQEAFRKSEERQQVLIEGVPQLVWRATDGGRWTWASPQWTDYTGQPEAESHDMGWLEPIHPEDRATARAAWQAAARDGSFEVDYRICRALDASYRWFRTRASALRDEQGATIEWLGTSTDIDDIRTLQARQEVLVGELQHRVRNMLSVVRSVFSRTAETAQGVDEVIDHFTGRLDSLARTQVIVTRRATGLVDLQDLIQDELLSVGSGDRSNVEIEGPDVELDSKTAESLGLAIHELTTNALKYGALRVPGARLRVSWKTNTGEGGGHRLDLVWEEQGVPTIAVRPARAGFGRELIEEALPYRLGAETKLEFRGGGVRCWISLPLGSRVADG